MTTHTFDIGVYGSCGGGLIAAITAARRGHAVVLLEWKPYIGGMITGGLGMPDYTNATPYGITTEFFQAIEAAAVAAGFTSSEYTYRSTDNLIGYYAPEWARTARDSMLSGASPGSITVVKDIEIAAITKDPTTKEITAVTLTNGDVYQASQWADESYEVDLPRLAGVPMTYGRDSALRFDEPMAGVALAGGTAHTYRMVRAANGSAYRETSMPQRWTDGQADLYSMANDWRYTFSQGSDRIAFSAPVRPDGSAYREADFADWIEYCSSRSFSLIGNFINPASIGSVLATTNGLDLTGISNFYPRLTSKADRLRYFAGIYYRSAGMLYAAQDAAGMPSALKTSVAGWGWPADQNTSEYYGTPGHSPEPYIREASRMRIAEKTLTFADIMIGVTQPDPIAIGGYNADSHTVQTLPTAAGGSLYDGPIDDPGRSSHFQIPFGCIKPPSSIVSNLLVGWGIACSRTPFSAYRVEPTAMVVGQAIGLALSLAVETGVPVAAVPYGALKELLVDASAIIS